MHYNVNGFDDFSVEGSDGELGVVTDFLLDDALRAVHHLVIETTSGLAGRRVLLSANSLTRITWHQKVIRAARATNDLVDCTPIAQPALQGCEPLAAGPGFADEKVYWLPLAEDGDETGWLQNSLSNAIATSALRGFLVDYPDGAVGRITDLIVDVDTWRVLDLVMLAPHLLLRNSQVLMSPDRMGGLDRKRRRIRAKQEAEDASAARLAYAATNLAAGS